MLRKITLYVCLSVSKHVLGLHALSLLFKLPHLVNNSTLNVETFSVGPLLGQCWQHTNNDVLSCNDSNHYVTLIQQLIASWGSNMQKMRHPKRKWNVWSRYPCWMFKNAPQGLYLIPLKSRPYMWYMLFIEWRCRF